MRHLVLAVATALVMLVVLVMACAPASHAAKEAAPAGPAPDPAPKSAGPSASADVSADVSEMPAAGVFRRFFAPVDPYELDGLDRSGPARGVKPSCPHDAIVAYRGKAVRYDVPASVHSAFTERLARFEDLVVEVATEVYGRPPKLLHHAGGYMCRTSWRGRMSEHAFGNALDVGGFTFAAIGKEDLARLRERGITLDAGQRRAFRIDVGDTWRPNGAAHAKHFFALLLERVRARRDVFRGMIGPPDPAHMTHLHLDAGPWAFSRYLAPDAEN